MMKTKRPYKILAIVGLILLLLSFVNSKNSFHQAVNLLIIENTSIHEKLAAHRVNYKNKLSRLLEYNVRRFELDLLFREGVNGEVWFEVGHDEGDATGIKFAEFLSSVPDKTTFIWLDIKNITPENAKLVLQHLESLDKDYGLQSRVIVETPLQDNVLRSYSAAGYITSYYAPVKQIMATLKLNDQDREKELAENILRAIDTGNFSSVSFSVVCYDFFRKYIIPKAQANLRYHIWGGTLNLTSIKALPRLLWSDHYWDEKVDTVLYRTYW